MSVPSKPTHPVDYVDYVVVDGAPQLGGEEAAGDERHDASAPIPGCALLASWEGSDVR